MSFLKGAGGGWRYRGTSALKWEVSLCECWSAGWGGGGSSWHFLYLLKNPCKQNNRNVLFQSWLLLYFCLSSGGRGWGGAREWDGTGDTGEASPHPAAALF